MLVFLIVLWRRGKSHQGDMARLQLDLECEAYFVASTPLKGEERAFS